MDKFLLELLDPVSTSESGLYEVEVKDNTDSIGCDPLGSLVGSILALLGVGGLFAAFSDFINMILSYISNIF